MKRKIIVISVAGALLAGSFAVVKNKQKQVASLSRPQASLPALQTAPVIQGTVELTSHYLASVEPLTKSDLSPRISGNILSITKREGDTVRQGELLITIDDRELMDRTVSVNAELLATRQKLAGARSAYATQKSIFGRDEALFQAGAISKEALERSRAALDGAKATVDAYEESIKGLAMGTRVAQTQASYARITAPFSGVVSKRWAEPGDLAAPGKTILTVEKTAPFKVLAQLPQEELSGIRRGTAVLLTSGAETLSAQVNRVYPSLGKNMLATVEVLTPSSPFGLPSSATVGFDLITRKIEGLIVPDQAVAQGRQGHVVYLVKDGVVKIVPVELAGSGNSRAAIRGELAPGDLVAVAQENKLLSLEDGSRVVVAGNPAAPVARAPSSIGSAAAASGGRP